jgi:hypothetical protein
MQWRAGFGGAGSGILECYRVPLGLGLLHRVDRVGEKYPARVIDTTATAEAGSERTSARDCE